MQVTLAEHDAALATLARWISERMHELNVPQDEHSETRDALIDRERVALEDAVLAIL